MNEKELITYYNKFNEDKRLKTKHGQVEFLTALKYINKYLPNYNNPKVLDIGAGTGAYTIELTNEGYDVTAIELVKHNLKVIEKKNKNIKIYQGNAIDLSRFDDSSFDVILLFGPMYHLISFNDKIRALNEAKRVCKTGGLIFISYCLNEYAIITHGFKDNYIKEEINNIDNDFKIISKDNDLYSFVRIEDINNLKNICKLKRVKIISQDGPTEYLKKEINKMDDETFNLFLKYHYSICEKKELLGAGRHILDILKK